MHGYETKELRESHIDALMAEKSSAESRLAHAEESLEAGAEGPQKAYHERTAARAKAEIVACDQQLKVFAAGATTKRHRASAR